MYLYYVKVVRWIDGDTCEVDLDLGFRITIRLKVRLAGVNTPELHDKDPVKRAAAAAALEFVLKAAPPGTTLTARTAKKYATDKYERWLIDFLLPDGETLTSQLLARGLATPYDGTGVRE